MINGYVDEFEDETLFVMAGFVAPAEQWAKFSDAWVATLAEKPIVRDFKTKDAMQSPPRGAFFGLTAEHRDEKLSRMIP